MREVIFWGATGQAKVLHDLIQGTDMSLVALIDNRPVGSPITDVPVLQGESGLDAWLAQRGGAQSLYFSVAVGGARGADRIILMDLLQARGLQPVTLVHPSAFVAHSATIGACCQILAQSAVCAHARLGRGVVINTAASVDRRAGFCRHRRRGPAADRHRRGCRCRGGGGCNEERCRGFDCGRKSGAFESLDTT
jgi:hypothetical protein